jgi:hypothetical protein
MNEHPELGYYDEGLDLVQPKLYAAATKPFGRAQILPPAAFRSKIFADLEDEKVWTRSWVCIGVHQQIPNSGDLLPFTVGHHGIHVQRAKDGSLIGRFNRAQHGGCRSIPAQCRTGIKTKCSFTSCGYSRDREAIQGEQTGEMAELGGQYLGDRPERLLPVKVDSWGPFIFVNLDNGCAPLATQMKGLAKQMGSLSDDSLVLAWQIRLEHDCNWKLSGNAFLENIKLPFAAESTAKTAADAPAHMVQTLELSPDYAVRYPALPPLCGFKPAQLCTTRLCWSFPNLLLVVMPDHVVSIILQPTATAATLARISLFVDHSVDINAHGSEIAELAGIWEATLDDSATLGVERQQQFSEWNATASRLPKEDSAAGYALQKFLVDSILREHEYVWSAPLFSQPGR